MRSELELSSEYPRILFHDKEGDRFVLHEDGSVYLLIEQPGYAAEPVDSVAPELTPYLNILLVTSLKENLAKHHNKDAISFAKWCMPLRAEKKSKY